MTTVERYYQVLWLGGGERCRVPPEFTNDCDAYNWAAYEMLLMGVERWGLDWVEVTYHTGEIGTSNKRREVCRIPYKTYKGV